MYEVYNKYCKVRPSKGQKSDLQKSEISNYQVRKGIDGEGEIMEVRKDLDGYYYPLPEGAYVCQFNGKDEFCSIDKIFTVEQREMGKEKLLDIPKIKLEHVEAEGQQNIFLYSDQLEEKFYNNDGFDYLPFDTPAFEAYKNVNQFTTNKERWDFLRKLKEQDSQSNLDSLNDQCYYLYDYDFPVVIFSKEKICGKDLFQDLKVLKNSKKVNIMYQAQVHGNEYAAGEGALAVIEKILLEQDLRNDILDKLNIVIIPCVNQLGNTQSTRDCGKININRDFLMCEAEETLRLHNLFFGFLPELVIDAHTFTRRNSFMGESLKKAMYDMRVSGAWSKNIDENVYKLNEAMVEEVISQGKKANFRAGYYSNTTNCHLGRVYYHLLGGCSILLESEGTRSGKFHFKRNVAGQVKGVLSIITYACRENQNIKRTVADSRRKFLDHSNINKEYIFNHVSSGENDQVAVVAEYDVFGQCIDEAAKIVHKRYDKAARVVKIPEVLVFEKEWFEREMEDLFMKNHVCFHKSQTKVTVDMNQITQFVVIELLRNTDGQL